jgi:hypothetical protein
MTQENILLYWLSEAKNEPVPEGMIYVGLDRPPFPDLTTLPAGWRDGFQLLLILHPEYLSLIPTDKRIQ